MRANRGMTLLETIVASGIFLVMLVVVVKIYQVGRSALVRTDTSSDAFRMAALAEDQFKQELLGSTVVIPDTSAAPVSRPELILYQPEQLDTREPRFAPDLSPPEFRLRNQRTTILTRPSTHGTIELVRTGGGVADRKLADLGENGSIQVVFPQNASGKKVARVVISARLKAENRSPDRQNDYILELDYAFPEVIEDPGLRDFSQDTDSNEDDDPEEDPDAIE